MQTARAHDLRRVHRALVQRLDDGDGVKSDELELVERVTQRASLTGGKHSQLLAHERFAAITLNRRNLVHEQRSREPLHLLPRQIANLFDALRHPCEERLLGLRGAPQTLAQQELDRRNPSSS